MKVIALFNVVSSIVISFTICLSAENFKENEVGRITNKPFLKYVYSKLKGLVTSYGLRRRFE
jgi:hypothetical protein